MIFKRYDYLSDFKDAVLPVLSENEALNNLSISLISGDAPPDLSNWFMGAVSDLSGRVLLVALCTKPFNIMLCPSHGADTAINEDALRVFCAGLKNSGFSPPGVFAVSGAAARFSEIYTGKKYGKINRSMILMRLDEPVLHKTSPGYCRFLCDDDLSFVPAWEQAFNIDCRLPPVQTADIEARIRTRLGRDLHLIRVDKVPVSQAVFGRETQNGGVITWVYTPPGYRGRGYGTSVVAELSNIIFKRGKQFCCLFADACNPVSRGIYKKLGYYDVAEFSEITF